MNGTFLHIFDVLITKKQFNDATVLDIEFTKLNELKLKSKLKLNQTKQCVSWMIKTADNYIDRLFKI